MRVDGAVKSLLQGVSQQPRETRFPGQCSEQINMSSNPVTGLARRPPLEFIADILPVDASAEFLEVTFGDVTYEAAVTADNLYLYTTEGELFQTIPITDTIRPYIAAGNLCSLGIDNTTYINSRNVVTRVLPGTMAYKTGSSIVSLLGGQYGRTFKITVTWNTNTQITVSFTAPTGANSADILHVTSTYIAGQLQAALAACATSSFNTLFSTTLVEDVIWIQSISSSVTGFTVTVTDDEGGTLIKACNNAVESLADLPRFAPSGYLATCTGLGQVEADNYYVSFKPIDETESSNAAGYFGTSSAGLIVQNGVPITSGDANVTAYGTFYTLTVDTVTHTVVLHDTGNVSRTVLDLKTGLTSTVLDDHTDDTTSHEVLFSTASINYHGKTIPANHFYYAYADDYDPRQPLADRYHVTDYGAGTLHTNAALTSFPETIYKNSTGIFTLKDASSIRTSTGAVLQLTSYTSGSFGRPGTWYEMVGPDLPYRLDPATMPVGLIRDPSTGLFTLEQLEWADRRCGDDETNPLPSFINQKIADLGYFQSRLGFISGLSCILSRTDKPLDFFRKTATETVDSDVIDMQSTAQNIGELVYMIPHNRDLILFADGAQFIILGRSALTPSNCSLILSTTFDADLSARPVSAGRNIFFATQYGRYIGIREFFTMDSIDANDSRPVTQHVLTYMPGTVKFLIGSSSYDTLWVIPDSLNVMYPYEYIWGDTTKLQSSWSTWSLPSSPIHGWLDGSELYLIAKDGNQYRMYMMDLDVHNDVACSYKVLLDNRVIGTCTSGVLEVPGYTADMVFVRGDGFSVPGMQLVPKTVALGNPSVVTFDTTESGDILYGIRYTSEYTPTMPFVRDADGVAIGTGKFLIKEFIFSTTNTGDISYDIESIYRPKVTGRISGRVVGSPMTVIGEQALSETKIKIPFRDDASQATLTIWTDSFTPMTLTNMEYRGEYIHKGTRLQQGK